MSSELPMDCRKILSRLTKDEYYVYMRPISSRWINPDKKHSVYWNVLVEYRAVNWQQWRAEGKNLADCIRQLGEEVPRRREVEPGWRPGKSGGWLAPVAVQVKAEAHAAKVKSKKKKSVEKTESVKKKRKKARR